MTRLLEKAFEKASALPPREQEAIADWLLKELESDARWTRLFAASHRSLSRLAAEALAEHRKGETKSLRLRRHR